MAGKSTDRTHTTALAIIPPDRCQPAIQSIREEHDRHIRRWMPHINLLYPFRPFSRFEEVAPRVTEACATLAPFQVTLARFRVFHHHRSSCTVWLDPEPREAIRDLHRALLAVCPDCDDTARHAGGFHPHLSVGQVRGNSASARAEDLIEALAATWAPIIFPVEEVALIHRGVPPDDVFVVDRTIGLSGC